MPEIGRRLYQETAITIISKMGYQILNVNHGNILFTKDGRIIYIVIVGKNLPYIGQNGNEVFPWETFITLNRLEQTELDAKKDLAEPWIAFCYAIFKQDYKNYFTVTARLGVVDFGLKLIRTSDYRKYMQPRSPAWSVVDIPRQNVPYLTLEIDHV